MPYLSPVKFRILAHRGSTEGGAVENTLEAFRYAVESGIAYIETDIQGTKDGVAVVFHDSNLHRLVGLKSRISDLTLDEIKKIKLPGGSRIPTLDEVLSRFPETKFNLDVKSAHAIAGIVESITSSQSEHRVLISSFSRSRRLKTLRQFKEQPATSADALTALGLWLLFQLKLKVPFAKSLSRLTAIQIPRSFGPLSFNRDFVSAVQKQGVEVHFWTINSLDEARMLLKDWGAAGIVTDKAKLMYEQFAIASK